MTIYSIEFMQDNGDTMPQVRAQGSLKLVAQAAKEALAPTGDAEANLSVLINEINANGTRSRLSITADRESLDAIVKVTLNRLRKEAKDAGQEDVEVAQEIDRAEAAGEAQAQAAQYGENPVTGY